jgi:hypothetical protein
MRVLQQLGKGKRTRAHKAEDRGRGSVRFKVHAPYILHIVIPQMELVLRSVDMLYRLPKNLYITAYLYSNTHFGRVEVAAPRWRSTRCRQVVEVAESVGKREDNPLRAKRQRLLGLLKYLMMYRGRFSKVINACAKEASTI